MIQRSCLILSIFLQFCWTDLTKYKCANSKSKFPGHQGYVINLCHQLGQSVEHRFPIEPTDLHADSTTHKHVNRVRLLGPLWRRLERKQRRLRVVPKPPGKRTKSAKIISRSILEVQKWPTHTSFALSRPPAECSEFATVVPRRCR